MMNASACRGAVRAGFLYSTRALPLRVGASVPVRGKKSSHAPGQHGDGRSANNTVLEFSVMPVGGGDDSAASHVGVAARTLKNRGLEHEVHAMGTIVEANLDEALDAIKECVEHSLKRCPRVSLSIRADIRPGKEGRLHKKRARIQSLLQNIE
eukprot:TRINITY_DN8186_c0_g1_i1.p3 TRINITY_DN8186_c0_g1~~TRINITY_DN8186_c0_g1_i1.p3  ORF type:complete len:153 (+),score=42.08 TRINITY_DN8186_c0_g1_i1:139-597(+)